MREATGASPWNLSKLRTALGEGMHPEDWGVHKHLGHCLGQPHQGEDEERSVLCPAAPSPKSQPSSSLHLSHCPPPPASPRLSPHLPFPSWSENIPTVASLLLNHVSKPRVEVYFYQITSYFFQQDTTHETFPDMLDHTRGCGSHLPLHLKYSKTYKCLNPQSDQGAPALLKALQWLPTLAIQS